MEKFKRLQNTNINPSISLSKKEVLWELPFLLAAYGHYDDKTH